MPEMDAGWMDALPLRIPDGLLRPGFKGKKGKRGRYDTIALCFNFSSDFWRIRVETGFLQKYGKKSEQFGMTADAKEAERIFRLGVNKQDVRLHMTFARLDFFPRSGQRMIPQPFWEW